MDETLCKTGENARGERTMQAVLVLSKFFAGQRNFSLSYVDV